MPNTKVNVPYWRMDAENLMHCMLAKRCTPRMIGERCGVTKQAVSQWLTQDRLLPDGIVARLEKAVGADRKLWATLVFQPSDPERLNVLRELRHTVSCKVKNREYNKHNKAGSFIVLGGGYGELPEEKSVG